MKFLRPSALLMLIALTTTLISVPGCGGAGPDPSMDMGGIDSGEVLQGLLARTRRVMSQVNGIDRAKIANKELQRINEDYDDLLYHLPRISEKGREALAKQSKLALPEMQAMKTRIREMPALDDILGESLSEMVAKLKMVR